MTRNQVRAAPATRVHLDAVIAQVPAPARDVIAKVCAGSWTIRMQRYARLYLDRLAAIRDADARANADGKLLRETARHLALRMSYEDVIRVGAGQDRSGAACAHRRRSAGEAGRAGEGL